jgi:hypothetical protein
MNCPSVRVRNTGSGYVKPDTKGSATANNDLKAKLAERAAQDAALWKPNIVSKPSTLDLVKDVPRGV